MLVMTSAHILAQDFRLTAELPGWRLVPTDTPDPIIEGTGGRPAFVGIRSVA